MAKVSVIVPVFKVEQYLPNCIDHLCSQTLNDIEIILVDDGSPDGCPEICDQYAARDTRIRVIHKENGGVSAARNDGLKTASGDFVIFCDSDDWMGKNALDELYSAAIESNADLVIGDVYFAYEDSSRNRYVKFYKDEFTTEDPKFISELIKADIYRTYCPNPPEEGYAFGYGGPWNKLVKRTLLLDNGIEFDLRLKGIFDDILYTAHVLSKAKKIRYIHKPVYYYRQVEGSLTHSYKPNIKEINKAIFNAWEELFAELDNPEQYREAYYACVLRRTEESIKLYFNNKRNPKSGRDLKKEFSLMMSTPPYKEAVSRASLGKVSNKQKFIAFFSRLRLYSLVLTFLK